MADRSRFRIANVAAWLLPCAVLLLSACLWIRYSGVHSGSGANGGSNTADANTEKKTAPRDDARTRRGAPHVVDLADAPFPEARARIEAAGARVLGTVDRCSLLVEADEDALAELARTDVATNAVAWGPKMKISERLAEILASGAEKVNITLVPLASDDVPRLETFLQSCGGRLLAGRQGGGRVRATLPCTAVARLAERSDVLWMEPFVAPRLFNDIAADVIGVREVWNSHGLTGRGQIIVTADSGLDTGDPETMIADFANQVCAIRPVHEGSCLTADKIGHGTHTAGSMVGNGALSDGQIRGIAYEARLWVWGGCSSDLSADDGDIYIPNEMTQLFAPDPEHFPSFISSHSWGGSINVYSSESVAIDTYLWNHPEVLAVFAAGNFGSGAKTICEQAAAKNVLAVGAVQNGRVGTYRHPSGNPAMIASYSSRGPMPDGRIKPEICAPGSGILSTRTTMLSKTDLGYGAYSNTNYTFMCGTSMATPLVAGAAALVRQWLVERRGYAFLPPTAALMKAILVGGARDMSAEPSASCGGAAPNNVQGWGRIDLEETLYPSNRSVRLVDSIPFAQGETFMYRVATTNAAPMEVQLAWTDYPGTAWSKQKLVNDLDLSVSNETTAVVWHGNGVEGGDRTNNVESVRIALAQPAVYTVRVTGHYVPHDHTEGGAAALYIRGAFRDGLTITIR